MSAADAFQLASAVIQVIDFSTKIIGKGHRLYKDGTTSENTHIEKTTAELERLSTGLSISLSSVKATRVLDPDEESFHELCNDCCVLAAKLRERLNTLKLDPSTTKNRRWKSLRQALKTVWSKEEIDAAASELDRYRTQLTLTTVVELRNKLQASRIENHDQFENMKLADMRILMAVLENRDVFNVRNDEMIRAVEHENEKSRKVFLDHLTALLDLHRILPQDENGIMHHDPRALEILVAAKSGNMQRLSDLACIRGTRFDVHDQFGRTALHFAADQGNLDMASFLLRRRANVNSYDDDRQRTPLHVAVIRDHVGMVKLLISRGAITELPDSAGCTPDAYAIQPLIVWMLKHGADLERLDPKTGNTVLLDAAIRGDQTMTHQLLTQGANTETRNWQQNTALIEACMFGRAEIVDMLLAHGANINVRGYADWTPVFICARFNKVAVLDVLLERYKPDLEVTCPHNVGASVRQTALVEATNCLRWDIAQRLAAKNANPNVYSDNGNTPLSSPCVHNHFRTARALLRIPGILIELGKNDWTPLKKTVYHNNWSIFRLLIENGANVHQKDVRGYPMLHRVIMAEYIDKRERLALARLLLDRGVDIEAKNNDGWTAMNEAIHAWKLDFIQLLLERGANMTSVLDLREAAWMKTQTTHFTYLMQAVFERYLPTIDILIDHGADLEAVNGFGWTALRYAVERGSTRNDEQDQACELLFRGADPTAKGRDGLTVVDIAKAKGLDLFVSQCVAMGKVD